MDGPATSRKMRLVPKRLKRCVRKSRTSIKSNRTSLTMGHRITIREVIVTIMTIEDTAIGIKTIAIVEDNGIKRRITRAATTVVEARITTEMTATEMTSVGPRNRTTGLKTRIEKENQL